MWAHNGMSCKTTKMQIRVFDHLNVGFEWRRPAKIVSNLFKLEKRNFSQWAWFSMSTNHLIGCCQNSAYPLLDVQQLPGEFAYSTRVYTRSCDASLSVYAYKIYARDERHAMIFVPWIKAFIFTRGYIYIYIGCPSIMTPWNMGKNVIFYSLNHCKCWIQLKNTFIEYKQA